MPGMDDYHAFMSTSGGGGSGGSGCSGTVWKWIIGIIAVLWLIGKLSG